MEKGCENCRHKTKDENEMPCVRCIRNAADKWEKEQDLVEVVRCAECKHYTDEPGVLNCMRIVLRVEKNDFCSFGERKEKR